MYNCFYSDCLNFIHTRWNRPCSQPFCEYNLMILDALFHAVSVHVHPEALDSTFPRLHPTCLIEAYWSLASSSIPKRPKAPCKVLLDNMHRPKLNLGMAVVDWFVHHCRNYSIIGVRCAWLSPRACHQLILCHVWNCVQPNSYASWQGLCLCMLLLSWYSCRAFILVRS